MSNLKMKRKKPQLDNRMIRDVDERVMEVEPPKPRVTSFVPSQCSSCTALREQDETAKGKNFSRVYATVGRTRYCKCGYCGHTWKQIADTTA